MRAVGNSSVDSFEEMILAVARDDEVEQVCEGTIGQDHQAEGMIYKGHNDTE